MEQIMNYVKPELIVVAIVLYFCGMALKQTQVVIVIWQRSTITRKTFTVLPFFVMVRLLGYPLFYRHGLRRKNLFVLQTCLSALVINYYKYFFITVKLRAIAVRNVLRQPLILPCSTCEAVRNFRYQRSCCRQII